MIINTQCKQNNSLILGILLPPPTPRPRRNVISLKRQFILNIFAEFVYYIETAIRCKFVLILLIYDKLPLTILSLDK